LNSFHASFARAARLASLLLVVCCAACARRPEPKDCNLIFVLVDTLRADAVFQKPGSTPALESLAREGTVFTRAYAQASWTLPSTSSLLAGRWPSESPGWADATQGIPDSVTPLAEILRGSGRATAAFIANPLINRDRGFGRGFQTWWASPVEAGVLTPAAEPVDQAIDWLKRHGNERFFLFMHLMDPHDPYCPPPRRVGPPASWPGQPDPAFKGAAAMPDAATIAQWKALYREEVSYMDSQIGRLLAAMSPDVRRRTSFVVTSDHGEEFLEHGFLKHAVTLFEEVVHVPLLVAAPGAPGGRRVDSLVRLVDVVPTVTDLLGVGVDPGLRSRWSGVSLAPAVRASGTVPQLTAMGETFGFGPLRWYVYDGRNKVVLFNRDHQLPTEIPALPNPNRWLTTHIPTEAVYVATPDQPIDRLVEAGEQRLVGAHELAARYAAGKVGGLWVRLHGSGRGGTIAARLEFPESAKDRFIPLFWRAGDSVRRDAAGIDLSVADDGATRLAVLVGPTEAEADRARLVVAGGAVPVRRDPTQSEGPEANLWFVRDSSVPRPGARNEMLFRLRALGYLN
jgi:arylsulfatase A-like enzyme